MGSFHLLDSEVELPLKKLLSSFTTTSGCSSGIKCPEFGTVIPVKFGANIVIPYMIVGIVMLPPNVGIYPPPTPIRAL